ncbi:MAG: hypothetical protein KC619_26365 [Myxococcales bacterium]|nr:hypothetical protein [Myxococcales bacterium]
MTPDALDSLQRRLLASVLVARFLVALALGDALVPSWGLVTVGVAFVGYLGILLWRAASSSRRAADVLALVLMGSAVAARLVMIAQVLSDSSSLVGMRIYFAAKVWTHSAEALALVLVAASTSMGRSLRAHPLALLCLVLVGIDLGSRTIADSGFGRRGSLDLIMWTGSQLGLLGLLLLGRVGWSDDPNARGPSRLRWVFAACLATWSLPLIPTVAAAVRVSPALGLVGAAGGGLVSWSLVLGSARTVRWPVAAVGLVAMAAVLGAATHGLGSASPADLGLGAASIDRWAVDVTLAVGLAPSALLLAAHFGRDTRSAHALAGVATLLLAATHWHEPLLGVGAFLAWLVTAALLHPFMASEAENDVSAT